MMDICRENLQKCSYMTTVFHISKNPDLLLMFTHWQVNVPTIVHAKALLRDFLTVSVGDLGRV